MAEWLRPLALEKHEPLAPQEWWALVGACCGLVMFAGVASGLTLGLMSLDAVDMEVLKRSGTDAEKRYAARIIPVIANEHFLLVTLLLCNAAATEALPLFLDRLADPLTAVLLSTSVVLVFGEVLPQALCSRYGLQIGASSAWFVRLLMMLAAPLAWPVGKLLDFLLGGEHTALFRRAQLKALVGLHAEEEGLGGTLSVDEIAIISGALDLTHKTAWAAMTPLDKARPRGPGRGAGRGGAGLGGRRPWALVFMLPTERPVDEACLQDILSRGHSRVPVYVDGDRPSIVGLILAKELVLVEPGEGLTVGQLPMRRLPRLAPATPLYDMLKLFEAGGSHMALLTRPEDGDAADAPTSGGGGGSGGGAAQHFARARSGLIVSGEAAYIIEAADATCGGCALGGGEGGEAWAPPGGWGGVRPGDPVGIITIEDVIEELLGAEIVDETDLFVDNQQTSRVDAGELSRSLPPRLRKVLARGEFTPRVGRLGFQRLGSSSAGGSGDWHAHAAGSPGTAPPQRHSDPAGHSHSPGAGHGRHHAKAPQFYYQQPGGSPGGGALAASLNGAQPAGGSASEDGSGGDGRGGGGGSGGGAAPRTPSDPVAISDPGAGSTGALSGTPGSWAAGANSGARRVRFGATPASYRSGVVLKPRLMDPDEEEG
ncbi:MAG: hypothetical protein J3K34DRAFT_520738 [Monoraphidium minutum]|nr:MAG: hypothetical protein J3K34DRAFT_520738 [Monoraphidium minutum]